MTNKGDKGARGARGAQRGAVSLSASAADAGGRAGMPLELNIWEQYYQIQSKMITIVASWSVAACQCPSCVSRSAAQTASHGQLAVRRTPEMTSKPLLKRPNASHERVHVQLNVQLYLSKATTPITLSQLIAVKARAGPATGIRLTRSLADVRWQPNCCQDALVLPRGARHAGPPASVGDCPAVCVASAERSALPARLQAVAVLGRRARGVERRRVFHPPGAAHCRCRGLCGRVRALRACVRGLICAGSAWLCAQEHQNQMQKMEHSMRIEQVRRRRRRAAPHASCATARDGAALRAAQIQQHLTTVKILRARESDKVCSLRRRRRWHPPRALTLTLACCRWQVELAQQQTEQLITAMHRAEPFEKKVVPALPSLPAANARVRLQEPASPTTLKPSIIVMPTKCDRTAVAPAEQRRCTDARHPQGVLCQVRLPAEARTAQDGLEAAVVRPAGGCCAGRARGWVEG